MELIFGNRKNNKVMPLWAIGKAVFILDSSRPYPIFASKRYAEFMIGAISADSSKNKEFANIYPVPIIRCYVSSTKEDIDVNNINVDRLLIHKDISYKRYPAPFLSLRLVGRSSARDKNEMYGINDYAYFNGLLQAINNSMLYVVNITKLAAGAPGKAEAINFAFNQAGRDGGMTGQEVMEFFKAYTTIKLLVSIHIMDLKAHFAPNVLKSVKNVDRFHNSILKEFYERESVMEENWSGSCRILDTYKELVDDPSFYNTPQFQRLKTQLKGFGVELTLPMTSKEGNIPPPL
jgi:hypothetical protein